MVSEQQQVTAQFDQLVADFPSDPRTPSLLRRLAKEDPDLFFASAAKELESGVESPAHRLLAILLIGPESFFERLANPARCSCASAVHLFKRLLTVDTGLDFKLARMLPGREDSYQDRTLSGGSVARAMDILDQTSPGLRLMSVIRHLPTNADARISSKAALLVGRRVNDPAWTERQLATENQRLRANALEASWGTKSEAALQLFRDCVGDASPRVAGNALIGLHLAGCTDVPERALAMSGSADPGLRSTAAWVMGRIGDQAYLTRLTALLRDENPLVRSTAVRSLVEIRRAEKKRLAAIAAHPEVKPAEAKAVEPAAPEPPAEKIEAAVEARLPEAPFELRLDGSSFKAGKRR